MPLWLFLLLPACAPCGGDDPYDRTFTVHVGGLDRPVAATFSVDLGREHYDCDVTLGDVDGSWEMLTEDCPGAVDAYFYNGELAVVLPVDRTPARAMVTFEAVGEDGVPYGFRGGEERIDWEHIGVCDVQGRFFYTATGRPYEPA